MDSLLDRKEASNLYCSYSAKSRDKGAAHRNASLLRCAAPLIQDNALNLQTFWRLCRWSSSLIFINLLIIKSPKVS